MKICGHTPSFARVNGGLPLHKYDNLLRDKVYELHSRRRKMQLTVNVLARKFAFAQNFNFAKDNNVVFHFNFCFAKLSEIKTQKPHCE